MLLTAVTPQQVLVVLQRMERFCLLTLLCTEGQGLARCGEPAILCKPETSVGLENSILDVVVAVVSSSTAPVDVWGEGGGVITLTWVS